MKDLVISGKLLAVLALAEQKEQLVGHDWVDMVNLATSRGLLYTYRDSHKTTHEDVGTVKSLAKSSLVLRIRPTDLGLKILEGFRSFADSVEQI